MEAATLPANSWSAKAELAELFAKLGLSKYTDLFRQQEVWYLTAFVCPFFRPYKLCVLFIDFTCTYHITVIYV